MMMMMYDDYDDDDDDRVDDNVCNFLSCSQKQKKRVEKERFVFVNCQKFVKEFFSGSIIGRVNRRRGGI